MRKLLLVLFPWRHKPWTRQQARMTTSSTAADGSMTQQSYSFNYLPPRDDLNSPDMYIPIMALITYILLSTVLAGIRGSFHPELLGSITSTAIFVVIFEIIVLKIAMYMLSITNESQLLDLVAYSGYKFVGVIVTLFISELVTGGSGTNNWVGWTLFLYTWYANAFFLVRTCLVARCSNRLTYLASIVEVCTSSRHVRRSDSNARRKLVHCCASPEKSSHIFSGLIRVPHPDALHVDLEPRRGCRQDGREQTYWSKSIDSSL